MFKVRKWEKFSIKKNVEIFCLYAAMPIKKNKKKKKKTKRRLSLKSFSISKSLSIKQT